MGLDTVEEIYKHLVSNWEIRIFVLVSLLLQILLIFLAPSRKSTASRRARLAIWSFYLLADWVADFALGLLANSQGSSNTSATPSGAHYLAAASANSGRHGGSADTGDANSKAILALWAPFLLLHLGGPDTITAFALEDNELWLRHLLGLGFELWAAGYVFFHSLPHNRLIAPTLIMFLVGIVKYGERTYSLYMASMGGFRNATLTAPDPGPNYAKLMEEYNSKLEAHLPAQIDLQSTPPDIEQVEEPHVAVTTETAMDPAYAFYWTFRCLFVDLILSFNERTVSRNFFSKCTPEEAFRVIEVELNFVYDQLYTKAPVIHTRTGYALRAVSSAALAVAFLLFFLTDKIGFNHIDIAVSYCLLWGAVCLDATAVVFLIFSDWTVVFLKERSNRRRVLIAWITTFAGNFSRCLAPIVAYVKGPRWSGKMSQFSLLSYCLGLPAAKGWVGRLGSKACFQRLTSKLFFKDTLDEVAFTSREEFPEELKEHMFGRLKMKSDDAKDLKQIKECCECRGARALDKYQCLGGGRKPEDVEFDESLLLWHIATDLCYYGDSSTDKEQSSTDESQDRDLSKKLSDYLLYLLVMQPAMMSEMAGIGLIRYRDTCAEVKRFFAMSGQKPDQKEATKMLLKVNTDVAPAAVKGDRSKSVLFDACILAKKLMEKNEERWHDILEVWGELLTYAASHCRGNAHARQLSRGGELLTLVWMLMAQLGLGEQYRIEAGHARAKLIVDK